MPFGVRGLGSRANGYLGFKDAFRGPKSQSAMLNCLVGEPHGAMASTAATQGTVLPTSSSLS